MSYRLLPFNREFLCDDDYSQFNPEQQKVYQALDSIFDIFLI